MNLEHRVRDLLRRVRDAYPGAAIDRRLARMNEPIHVAVVGTQGKSTLVKALADQPFRVGLDEDADAVIYLMAHTPDVRPLTEYQDQSVIGVLARADEIGGGRLDALTSARQVARRYAADPRLRGVCQTVVPVAGLLAHTAKTLRQDEVDVFIDLVSRPRAEIDSHLLSSDRVKTIAAGLLDRFGLFGIRLGVTLVRQGFSTRDKLAVELIRRSGLGELCQQLDTHFCERSQLLKSRSTLIFINAFLRQRPNPGLRADVERLMASAHEFVEVRLLDAVRAGQIGMPDDVAAEAERLLGGDGAAIGSRLGLRGDPVRQREIALRTLGKWRVRAENPVAGRQFVDAARVIVRTCEGMVARLS
ncbi:hypothetical protein LWC34_13550 [Kibdelosporangium philippinense]|uniref:GTPase n=1 Tax=Kibdelosporangium philippinense TaxID=211113 RepID=A0ABS8Z7I1_9PSEU|nr:hypothetical protein [Kibdelosporangium philippinense]MCE7003846.1 hypothetical protein [Kibdelosporangium philippinense]